MDIIKIQLMSNVEIADSKGRAVANPALNLIYLYNAYFLLYGNFQLPLNMVVADHSPLEGGCQLNRVNSPPPFIPVYFPVPPT